MRHEDEYRHNDNDDDMTWRRTIVIMTKRRWRCKLRFKNVHILFQMQLHSGYGIGKAAAFWMVNVWGNIGTKQRVRRSRPRSFSAWSSFWDTGIWNSLNICHSMKSSRAISCVSMELQSSVSETLCPHHQDLCQLSRWNSYVNCYIIIGRALGGLYIFIYLRSFIHTRVGYSFFMPSCPWNNNKRQTMLLK
jgi:hypothetical protein